MKKKLISVLLCLAMVATMAVGCGGSGEEENTEDIEKMSALIPSDDEYLKTT